MKTLDQRRTPAHMLLTDSDSNLAAAGLGTMDTSGSGARRHGQHQQEHQTIGAGNYSTVIDDDLSDSGGIDDLGAGATADSGR